MAVPKRKTSKARRDQRRANWKPRPNRYTSGTLKFFTEHAVSAIKGGYME